MHDKLIAITRRRRRPTLSVDFGLDGAMACKCVWVEENKNSKYILYTTGVLQYKIYIYIYFYKKWAVYLYSAGTFVLHTGIGVFDHRHT